MPASLTFVNVNLDGEAISANNRGAGISTDDRSRIRSLAAARPREGRTQKVVRQKREQRQQKPKVSASQNLRVTREPTSSSSPESDLFLSRQSPSSSTTNPSELVDGGERSGNPATFTLIDPDLLDIDACVMSNPVEASSDFYPWEKDVQCIVEPVEALDDMDIIGQDYYLPTWSSEDYIFEPAEDSSAEEDIEDISSLAIAAANVLPSKIRSDRIDPFWTFSIPYRPFLSRLIHHRATVLAPPFPGLDKPGENNALECFIIAMEAPSFLFASVLSASLHIWDEQKRLPNAPTQDQDPFKDEERLWLRGCAISTTNELLRKPNMTRHDIELAMCAVISIALVEGCFGDPEVSEVHMQGWKTLARKIGGIQGLQPPLQKNLRWTAKSAASYLMETPDSPFHRWNLSRSNVTWSSFARHIDDIS